VGGALAATSESGYPGGGGVVVDGGSFTANHALGDGGALNLANLDTVDVAHATFCANRADDDGGGVRVTASGGALLRFTNDVFSDNVSADEGGGLYLDGVEPAEIENDTFLGNAAGGGGGGIGVVDASAVVTNTLVAFGASGDGIATPQGPVPGIAVTYSAFWDNAATDLPALLAGGVGNVFVDPQLTAYTADGDCTNDEVWPAVGSPLIDAGDPALLDPDGSPSDIGAYGGPAADLGDTVDEDGDGFTGANDCDDGDETVNPDAVELCDGIDQDCDGAIDDGATDVVTYYGDDDADGYGVEGDALVTCTPPPGYATELGDCDDGNEAVNPGAAEVCDGLDNDCDQAVDEDVVPTWYPDADGDGYGAEGEPGVTGCDPPEGTADQTGDCDDADPAVNPGADDPEGDGVDQNCDGADGVAVAGRDETLTVTSGCDGCATGGTPSGMPLLVVGLLALLGRRSAGIVRGRAPARRGR
jgi:uncharacterized protein (TIGR03382 family)